VHRHIQGDRDAPRGFAIGQLDRRSQCLRAFVGQKRLPDAFDCRRHRREVDAHFVRKAVRIVTQHLSRHDCGGSSGTPKGVFVHLLRLR
jgi:hypothetical protein